jgi:hypothetical protein
MTAEVAPTFPVACREAVCDEFPAHVAEREIMLQGQLREEQGGRDLPELNEEQLALAAARAAGACTSICQLIGAKVPGSTFALSEAPADDWRCPYVYLRSHASRQAITGIAVGPHRPAPKADTGDEN